MDVAQIRFEGAQQALEVLKQKRGINHQKVSLNWMARAW
jgi:hypothetical protein